MMGELDSKLKQSADINLLWEFKYPEENFFDFQVKKGSKMIKLATFRYCLTDDPKCVIILFHSLNGHINTSGYLSKCLAEEGCCVVGYDQRGYGKSEGLRSYIEDFDFLLNDARTFIDKVKELYPNKPVFIGGLSLGGLITYRLTLENKNICQGAIMFAPALNLPVGCFLKGVGSLLGSIMPRTRIGKGGNRKSNSKHPISVQNLLNDPLCYNGGGRPGTLKSMLQGMKNVEDTFKDYEANYIMFFGAKDSIVSTNSSLKLINEAKSKDKTLYYYENLFHDIWHEEEMFDIVPKLLDWIKKRVPEVKMKLEEEKKY